jgi:TonB-linked SusC/RagA family outer membrane protein
MKAKFSGILTLALVFFVHLSFAQEKTISGTVTDESGLPLPGVNILIKGTTNGTQTDFDGNYTINASVGNVLSFTYVGLKTEERTVGSENTINLIMIEDAAVLDEVVVTAYGTVKKESLTGSITEVGTEEFAKVASGNAVTGLTGKVAGVQIFSNTGQPGAAPIVRFRGIGSLNGSSAPLYVVDGVPFTESITTINPNDIESMSFVKDASAAALYGNRGANGVIIITTKKGKKGKVNLTLDVKTSITRRAVKDYNVMTGASEYLEAYHKMLKNNDITLNGSTIDAAGIAASNGLFDGPLGVVYNPFGGDRTSVISPDGVFRGDTALWQDDWRDFLLVDSGVETYYLSFSGATDNTSYFVSLGHEDNKGLNINTGFKRSTLKTNIESSISEDLKVGLSLSYTNRIQKGTLTNNITGNFAWIRDTAPIYPVFAVDHNTGALALDANGNKQWDWADVTSPNAAGPRPWNGFSNPHALQTLNVNKRDRDNLTTRAFATYDFLNDFSFTYTFGYDLADYNLVNYTNNKVGSASSSDINGRLNEEYGKGTTITNQQLLRWKKSFNDLHNFEVLVGHESTNYDFKFVDIDLRNQFISSDISPDLFAVPDGTDAILGNPTKYNLEGYFARVLYDFNGKYYLNGSFRRDGSSVFHPDNKWGNFYGAGVAWRISKESFLRDVSWLNELKLKSSFGQQGNDIVNFPNTTTRNYTPYLDQWNVVKNGTGFDLQKTVLGNKDLTWETSTNFNVGFESSFLDNRLNIDAEYFVREISDLIHNRELPASTGFPAIPENVMTMENRGVEAIITYDVIRKEDLNLSVEFNGTHYKNEITELVPGKEFLDDPLNTAYRWKVGGSAFEYFMRDFVGVNPSNGNALWRTDAEFDNSDPANPVPTNGITESYALATEYFVGKSALPDLFGGFSANLTYKNFDFGINFSYQIGGYAYDAIYNDGFDGAIGNNFHRDFWNTWTWDNPTATLPRVDTDTRNWSQFSDFHLIESDYLSLNDITLGYSIPASVAQKIGVSKLRIYGNANNVALWTKADRQGFDPRQRVTGGNNAVRYPALSTYTLGININF